MLLYPLIWTLIRTFARAAARPSYGALAGQACALDATPLWAARDGTLVRVLGTVQPHDHWITAPLSHRPCAAWQLRVGIRGYDSVLGEHQLLVRGVAGASCPFELRDGGDACLVDPASAELALSAGALCQARRVELPDEIVQLCASRGLDVGSRSKLWIEERVLAMFEPASVAGCARRVERAERCAGERGYRAEAASWLRFDREGAELLIGNIAPLQQVGATVRSAATPGWGTPDSAEVIARVREGRRRRTVLRVATCVLALVGLVAAYVAAVAAYR